MCINPDLCQGTNFVLITKQIEEKKRLLSVVALAHPSAVDKD